MMCLPLRLRVGSGARHRRAGGGRVRSVEERTLIVCFGGGLVSLNVKRL
jgi:hypothetical protein